MTRNQPALGMGGTIVAMAVAVMSLAVAGWTSTTLISVCVDALRLQNAVQVDAQILEIERIDGGEAGDRVYVTYAYDYAGQRHQFRTRRLALFDRSSEFLEPLELAWREGHPVPCFVDPERPSLSVFSTSCSTSLLLVSAIFPVGFGAAGVIVGWSVWRRWRQARGTR